MIKEIGICDICSGHFEVDGVNYAVQETFVGVESEIRIIYGVKSAPLHAGFKHICGKTCLLGFIGAKIDSLAAKGRGNGKEPA